MNKCQWSAWLCEIAKVERKEAIIVDVPSDVYQQIAAKAVRYALISVGFTYNRMEKEVIMTRIENIAKGYQKQFHHVQRFRFWYIRLHLIARIDTQ